jgi:hypothetical protein
MAVTGEEIRPREFTDTSATRVYRLTGADTETDAYIWLTNTANVPLNVSDLPRSKLDAKEDPEIAGDYDVVVTWGTDDSPEASQTAGTSSYRFSFQAPSGHIKRSLATISETEDTAIFAFGPPPMHGAINVVDFGTADVHTEGFDLQPPPEVFTIPYTDVDANISAAYQATVRYLCGKVNSFGFYGAAAGEIMLVRADGQRTGGLWNLDFGFAYIPNATSIPVGDNIVVPSKDGMDLLWALEITSKDDTAKALITQPACAYVERVWERADLNDLNLP